MSNLFVSLSTPASRVRPGAARAAAVQATGAVRPAQGQQTGPRTGVSEDTARSIEKAIGARRQPALYDHRGRMPAARPASAGDADERPVRRATAAPSGSLAATAGGVSVEITDSDSGYENQIVVSTDGFATWRTLGIDNQRSGPIALEAAAGAKLEFGIVNGEGTLLRAGDAALNPDGRVHARVSTEADGTTRIGFEDLYGGGDEDFNDAVILVRGLSPGGTTPPPVAPIGGDDPPVPVEDGDDGRLPGNRSGLGDGSNPGVGGGTTLSPNTGTANPSAGNRGTPRPGAVDDGSAARPSRPANLPERERKAAAELAAAERRRQLLASVYEPAQTAAKPRTAKGAKTPAGGDAAAGGPAATSTPPAPARKAGAAGVRR